MGKKKSKGLMLESAPPCGVGGFEDAKATLRREALMQDYGELEKEANAMRSKLEVAKQKRLILAAEVRFLRRKYKHFVKTKNMNLSQECTVSALTSHKQVQNMKEQILGAKAASRRRLPPLPDSRPNKKRATGKQVAPFSTSPSTVLACNEILRGGKEGIGYSLDLSSDSTHKGRMHLMREALVPIMAPILDKERALALGANRIALRHLIGDFDLNPHNNTSRQEASLPNRAPIFDLNEISTGDNDFQNNNDAVKFEEAKKSFMRSVNDEQQTDLKFSSCRNVREGSARVGKRKISWQDPVALRV